MFNIETDITIHASIDKIWERLLDFRSYPTWNPFIRVEQGVAKRGSSLLVRIIVPGAHALTIRPKISKLIPNREIRWRSSFFFRWLFDSEIVFLLDNTEEGAIIFKHSERFRGILIPLLLRFGEEGLLRGCEEMNVGLKDQVESS